MFRIFLIALGILTLTACTLRVGPPAGSSSSTASQPATSEYSSPNEAPPERETHNVTYRGIVQPAGISIYMQGSHRLVLPDGRFVLLESSNVDLNGYVGEDVELVGSTRPTVEANGIIMRVDGAKVILPLEKEKTKESEETEESSASSETNTSSLDTLPSRVTPSVPSESEGRVEGKDGSTRDDTRIETGSANLAVIETMAAEKFSAEHWTQEYCSSHIGFCIPVHRNWWYKSFGTTTSALWHIEVGNSPVLNLGDGPIIINLLPGDLALENQATTDTQLQNGMVIAVSPWSGDRHFEIRAQAQLEIAVRYMIDHISPYEGN